MPTPIITLTTDFGLADAYVAAMKGVILGLNPRATLVDISHEVGAQDILHGAFLLGSAHRYFPQGTIHVAVVDPGVGTSRRALLVETPREYFVLPDNGLLTLPLREAGALQHVPEEVPLLEPVEVPLPAGWHAWELTNPEYWRHLVSSTFHGRDVFAPVAAHLSLGVEPAMMGVPVDTALVLHVPQPRWREGCLEGHVLRVDGFGNVITSLEASTLPPGTTVEVAGTVIHGLSRTYGDARDLTALAGSHGYLEVAVPGGNAAARLGCKVGDIVRAWPARGTR